MSNAPGDSGRRSLRRLGILACVLSGAVAAVSMPAHGASVANPSNFGILMFALHEGSGGSIIKGPLRAGVLFSAPITVQTERLGSEDDDSSTPPDTTEARSATYDVDVPAGLTLLGSGAIRGGPVSTTCVSRCPIQMPAGTAKAVAWYRFVAATPGTYILRAHLTSTSHPDPDPPNDAFAFEIKVQAAGGGGAASTTAVRISKRTAVPAVPKAGKAYVLKLVLTRGGVKVKASSVRCQATVGGQAVRGRPSKTPSCRWMIPIGTSGKLLRANLAARVSGRVLRTSKSVRIA